MSDFLTFEHEDTVEMFAKMGLNVFFTLVSILEGIILSCLLVKKLTLLVNQGAQKARSNFCV